MDSDFKEHNGEDHHPVRALLNGLEQVQADWSFEARLQQRLAQRQKARGTHHPPFAAYAVSIAGAVLIGAFTYSWLSPGDESSIQSNEILVPEKANDTQLVKQFPPRRKMELRPAGEQPLLEQPGRGPSDGQAEVSQGDGVISNHRRGPAAARLIDSLTFEISRIDSADSLQNQADSIHGDLN